MARYFDGMPANYRLFAYAASISALFLIGTFLSTNNYLVQVLAALFCVALIFLTAWIVVPAEERRQKTIRYSSWTLMVISITVLAGSHWLSPFEIFAKLTGLKIESDISNTGAAALVVGAALLGHLAVVFFAQDRSSTGRHSVRIEDEFRDLNFTERMQIFCEELKADLQILDRDLRWNISHFVSLHAEVEIVSNETRSRKVMDLLQALRKVRAARIHLVLGVPGAGKSVALRKLCADLLSEVKHSGRIPVYVNLKEWMPDRQWTFDNPPTEKEFSDFVYGNVRTRLADQSKPFFEEYFKALVESGRIFFVFDSFDEIPGILDANETSALLEKLSFLLTRFIKAGLNSRGIIASRYFRRPHIIDNDRSLLEIRPFGELQISRAIERASADSPKLIKTLLHERPDLGSAARNPFVLGLILRYVAKNKTLPPNQEKLFESYIDESLAYAQENADKLHLSHAELLQAMEDMSWAMFSSKKFGLEIPAQDLQAELTAYRMEDVISVLRGARLIRVGAPHRTLSFVHRRFNEYFLVHRFIGDPASAPYEAIPEDSRWRDAMVLFAEVCDETTAHRIANDCWKEISQFRLRSPSTDITQYLRSLHSLRFIAEAFRGRRTALADFRYELGVLVYNIAYQETDLVTVKHAVEVAGLIEPEQADDVIVAAISQKVPWISETALRACRYLTSLNIKARDALLEYVRSIPTLDLIKRDRELSLALQTADVFLPIRRELRIQQYQSIAALFASIVTALLMPGSILLVALFYILFFIVGRLPFDIIQSSSRAYSVKDTEHLKNPLLKFLPSLNSINLLSLDGIIFSYQTAFVVLFLSALTKLLGLQDQPQVLWPELQLLSPKDLWTLPNFMEAARWPIIFSLAILMFPWVSIARFVRQLAKTGSIFKIAYPISGLLFPAIVGTLLGYLPVHIQRALMISILSIAVLFIAGILISMIWRYTQDRQTLKRVTMIFSPDKIVLSRHFLEFRTRGGRLEYIHWIETQAGDHLAELSDPKNIWPSGNRPNCWNDPASSLLAQLEARWLRLDV